MAAPAGPAPEIPDAEIAVAFSRSSGPGGQNVNKRETKAEARWHVGRAAGFSAEQKARIRAAAGRHLNAEDEIVIQDQSERSQEQNRESAVARLHALVRAALAPVKARRPTRAPRAQKEKRLRDKRANAEKKSARRDRRGGAGDW
jgi:ribosome-associated protein